MLCKAIVNLHNDETLSASRVVSHLSIPSDQIFHIRILGLSHLSIDFYANTFNLECWVEIKDWKVTEKGEFN